MATSEDTEREGERDYLLRGKGKSKGSQGILKG